jgi:nitrite reductase/ring-hydroxylating ferredoxin subunit
MSEANVRTEPPPRAFRGKAIPQEGEGGLFTQSWYPVCLSEALADETVVGVDFLDGRVVAFRDERGQPSVLSAYCPHGGAELSAGECVDGRLRCAFHHWEFDSGGRCVRTGVGDPPPPGARLFRFPVRERFGLIWAFNGTSPHFELPEFPHPDDALVIRAEAIPELFPVDPWVLCANTPDIQHIRSLHGISFERDPAEAIEWTESSMFYEFRGRHAHGERIEYRVGIVGTSIFYQSGTIDGRWFGFLAPFAIPKPGFTRTYLVLAARREEGDAASTEAFLDAVTELEKNVVGEDAPIMATIRYRQGTLTRSDRALSRFLQYVRDFPRAHPSADFIR